jgi:hypothetical protein
MENQPNEVSHEQNTVAGTRSGLFNENIDSVAPILLEQYKLYIETANATSSTRIQANTFFLTINTTLVGFVVGVVEFSQRAEVPLWMIFACVVGLFLCAAWFALLRAYRNLNSARYQIIHELEKKLPANIYAREWQIALHERPKRRYVRQTFIEQMVPIGFGLLYITLIAALVITGQ